MEVMFSVGHSNQTLDNFVDLLKTHDVQVIVDVRSHPFSKYSVQFDLDSIKVSLEKAALRYLYLGKELGGMPRDEHYQNAEGRADYAKLAASPQFQEGIRRLLKGGEKFRIALMCGEENPTSCHRRHLIAPALLNYGIELRHIRGNGSTMVESDFLKADRTLDDGIKQLSLF